ncbi:MAG TPA: transposase, partial [Beggiatoa sp.]|nr:transposase [Beggiatoa sp.]
LLIEFQSTIDDFMAVRIMVYVGLLYQHLIETQELTGKDKLPAVLPIVIYNGIPRWNANKNISELVEKIPGGIRQYCPHLRYLLIDEGSYPQADLAKLRNLVAALFRLEQTRAQDTTQATKAIREVLSELLDWLKEPKWFRLRADWLVWLKRVLFVRNKPHIEIPEVHDLEELNTMLYENMQAMYRRGEEDAMKAGVILGEKNGIIKGQAKMLIQLLDKKFGEVNKATRDMIYELDEEELWDCVNRLQFAQSLDDVVRHIF